MALVSMRELLDHAAANGYGIPAFNVNNLEQVQAVMEAARETGAPVILQASAGARKYAGEAFIKHLIQAAVEMYPQIPLVMHQDHGQSPDVCQGAINLGFSSVMMDGSPGGRRQDHRQLRLQRGRDAQGGRHGPPAGRDRRRRTGLPRLAWRP
jgi:fructose-bisphosphate aldolase class II